MLRKKKRVKSVKKISVLIMSRSLVMIVVPIMSLVSFVGILVWSAKEFSGIYWVLILLNYTVVFHLIRSSEEPAFKIAWFFLLLHFPLVGGGIYLLLQGKEISKNTNFRSMEYHIQKEMQLLYLEEEQKIMPYYEDAKPQLYYFQREIHSPAFQRNQVRYFGSGENLYQEMIRILKKAQNYIFLEYFLISHGAFWTEILKILKQKAQEGLEIRVIYDDAGCFFHLDQGYPEKMAQLGIKAQVFHSLSPRISRRSNHRNHRKLLIVDGTMAITGGVNISDEYINQVQRFGYWKDGGVSISGSSVRAMVIQFLGMWEYCSGLIENMNLFFPEKIDFFQETSIIVPYNSIPKDCEAMGQRVFLNLITRAKRFIHITTPYLVLDTATQTALCNAGKSGIEVVILTPHIPDKKLVFQMTRAFYVPLIASGVQIYEFTPGFIHEKKVIVDNIFATIGTVNLDYRSLFLHFENGIWLWNSPCIQDMEEDFQKILAKSQIYTESGDCRAITKIMRGILRLFSPLL